MKRRLQWGLASLSCFTSLALAAPACPLPDLEKFSADSPTCYFYSGTTAYRNKDFKLAAQHWKSLIALKDLPADQKYWQVHAYNNLGFLYYQGWGMVKDRKAALNYWKFAFDSGHEEAAYHLCHFYADPKSESFDRAPGGQYCREALRRYGVLQPEKGTDEIERQIKGYLKHVDAR